MYAEPDVTVPIGFVTGVHEPSPHGQLYDAKCDEWKQLCGQLRHKSNLEVDAAKAESDAKRDLPSHKRLDYAKNSRTALNLEINAFEVELDLLINMNNLGVFMEKFDAHRQKLIDNFNVRKYHRTGIPRRAVPQAQPVQRQRSPPAEPVGLPRRAIPVRVATAAAARPVMAAPVPQLTRAQLAAEKHRERLEAQRAGPATAPAPAHPSAMALAISPLDEQRAQQVTRRTQTAQQKHMERLQADNLGAGISDVQGDWRRYVARTDAEKQREAKAEELRLRRSAAQELRLQTEREERERQYAVDKAKSEKFYADIQAEIDADEAQDRENRRQRRRQQRELERDPVPVARARPPVAGPSRGTSPVAGPSRGPSPVAGPSRGPSPVAGPSRGPSPVAGPSRGPSPLAGPSRGPSPMAGPSRPAAPSRLARPTARLAPTSARPVTRLAPPAAPVARPAAAHPEAIWLRYYDEICTEIENLNQQLQESYQQVQDERNFSNCAAKLSKFLVDRDRNRREIIAALNSNNPDSVAEATFRAIRPLEGEQFMCNDVNDPENQALVLRIRALPRRIEDTLDTMRWSVQGGREPAARRQSTRPVGSRLPTRPPTAHAQQQHAVADASPASIEAARRNAAQRLQNIDHPPGAVRTVSSTSMLNASRRYAAEAGAAAEAAEAAEADGGAARRRPRSLPPIDQMLLTGSAVRLGISARPPGELERSMRRTNEEFEEMMEESPGRDRLRDKLHQQLMQTKRSGRRPTSAVDIRGKLLTAKKPAKYVSAYRQSPRVRPPPSEGESGYHRAWLQNLNQTLAEESLQQASASQKPPPLMLRDTQVRDYLFDDEVRSQMDDLDLSMHIAMQLHDNPEGRARYEQSARRALQYPDQQLDWVRQDMGIGAPEVDYSHLLDEDEDESEAENEVTVVEQQQQHQHHHHQEPEAGDTDSERGVAGAIAVAQALNDSIQRTAIEQTAFVEERLLDGLRSTSRTTENVDFIPESVVRNALQTAYREAASTLRTAHFPHPADNMATRVLNRSFRGFNVADFHGTRSASKFPPGYFLSYLGRTV